VTRRVAPKLGAYLGLGAFGLLAAPAADWLGQRLPQLTVAIGLILAGLGAWLLAGRSLPSPFVKVSQAPELTRRFGSMYVFGLSFALASLGCTVGPFLAVVATSFSSPDGVLLFLAYAGGMALVVGTVAIAVAFAQKTVIGWLRRSAGVANRVAGGLMLLAGLYVAWYGWFGGSPLAWVDQAQVWLTTVLDRIIPV
jgi:cytochrome c biogenesis protein CcdA